MARKVQATFSFEPGSITVRRSGYLENDGSGWFCFDEADICFEPYEERDGNALIANVAKSELLEIRDFLNREFPPGSTPDLLAALRGMIGLVQLIVPTLPKEQRELVEGNHRLVDARAAIAKVEGGAG